MNLKVYIIDDEQHAIQQLREHVETDNELSLVGTESNPLLALENILSGKIRSDITFLDIHMPGMSGIDLAVQILPFTHVILVTGDKEHAVNAFEYGIDDYVVKPIFYSRFKKSIDRVKERISLKHSSAMVLNVQKLTIKVDGKFIIIDFDDLLYLESQENFVKVFVCSGKSYLTLITMQEIENRLPIEIFMRIHRCHMVNMQKVISIEGNMVELSNGPKLAISQKYRALFKQRFIS